jgi:hypothetical protein
MNNFKIYLFKHMTDVDVPFIIINLNLKVISGIQVHTGNNVSKLGFVYCCCK